MSQAIQNNATVTSPAVKRYRSLDDSGRGSRTHGYATRSCRGPFHGTPRAPSGFAPPSPRSSSRRAPRASPELLARTRGRRTPVRRQSPSTSSSSRRQMGRRHLVSARSDALPSLRARDAPWTTHRSPLPNLSGRSRHHRATGHRPGFSLAPWTLPLAIGLNQRWNRLLTGPSRRSRRLRHPRETIG